MNETPSKLYKITGTLAIIAGATLSAFSAKTPSTFAMWATAYLVLVVGVAQVFFGIAIVKILPKNTTKLLYCFYALFNTGSALVISSTALKYADYSDHMFMAVSGSALIIAALSLLTWHMRHAKPSLLKLATFVVLITLIVSVGIGLVLATWH